MGGRSPIPYTVLDMFQMLPLCKMEQPSSLEADYKEEGRMVEAPVWGLLQPLPKADRDPEN